MIQHEKVDPEYFSLFFQETLLLGSEAGVSNTDTAMGFAHFAMQDIFDDYEDRLFNMIGRFELFLNISALEIKEIGLRYLGNRHSLITEAHPEKMIPPLITTAAAAIADLSPINQAIDTNSMGRCAVQLQREVISWRPSFKDNLALITEKAKELAGGWKTRWK